MNRHDTPPEQVVKELLACFSAHDYAQLDRRATEVLARYPDFAFGWKALSVARTLTGGDALPAARRAVELLPGDAEAHNNFAKALLDADQPAAAKQSCLAALALDPANPLTLNNLGNTCRRLGEAPEAQAAFERALQLLPGFAEAAFNLAMLLAEGEQPEAAIAAFRRVLALRPGHPASCRGLARGLLAAARTDEAEQVYRQALSAAPGRAELADDFSALLAELGRPAEALNWADAALTIDAARASAHNNRGVALLALGRLEAARQAFERAIALDGRLAAAQVNLGNALRELLRPEEAAQAYRAATEGRPDDPELAANILLAANYFDDTAALPLVQAIAAQDRRATARSVWSNSPDRTRPLRVGMVSADLREHPVGRFLDGPLRELQGRDLELFAYYNHAHEDSVSAALKPCFAAWRNIFGASDGAVEKTILADRIDILIDLSGHTDGGRMGVFARKPAPVQVAWFGYFATTGLSAIDYILADPVVLPRGEEDQFVETPWRLPETYYCFTPPAEAPPVAPLPAASGAPFVFGCCNSALKLNDAVLDCWAAILRAKPESILLLKSRQYANPEVTTLLADRFERRGVDSTRLRFEAASSREAYLRAYDAIDIALDPFPFTGGATSAEALWMGVPVLSGHGDRFIAHQGETILRSMGLDDWIAGNRDDYVALALAKAADTTALAALRGTLRDRLLASPFADAKRFAANLDAAWRGMWEVWCAAQASAPAAAGDAA